jgi:RimJ/RimL family protein N-acetyltransferase
LGRKSTIEVRRVRAGEGERLRELRLRALRDSPHAFYSSLDEEEAKPLDAWKRHTASLAESEDEAMFVAVEHGDWVGMAGGFRHPLKPSTVTAWAGWVHPRARSRGLGLDLVEAVSHWARTMGASRLETAVAESNDAAQAFCRRAGFTPTGEVKPVPWDSTVRGIFMERSLLAGSPAATRRQDR